MDILFQLQSVFNCLSVAMRYEPANANFFQLEVVSGSSLRDAISMLGCFSSSQAHSRIDPKLVEGPAHEELVDLFRDTFQINLKTLKEARILAQHPKMNPKLFFCCLVIRMLYDMAIDGYEKASVMPRSPRLSQSEDSSGQEKCKKATPPPPAPPAALNLSPPPPEPIIVHSSLITIILQLLPTLRSDQQDEYSLALQAFVAEVLQSLLRTEKNQQVMCDVDFLSHILMICRPALENEGHALHSPFQYLLERLSAQKLKAADLRVFLRLGNPLATLDPDETAAAKTHFVPLTRIKTIVSMTTPRDLHQHNTSILPPFIELDMAPEGFGCLFLPSIGKFRFLLCLHRDGFVPRAFFPIFPTVILPMIFDRETSFKRPLSFFRKHSVNLLVNNSYLIIVDAFIFSSHKCPLRFNGGSQFLSLTGKQCDWRYWHW